MNNRIPVRRDLLRVGTSLTHDIYDRTGKLLLRHGSMLESEALLERLEEMGYFDPEAVEALKSAAAARERVNIPGYIPDRSGQAFSAFAQLGTACQRLQIAFSDSPADLGREIVEIVALIRQCCALDNDASLSAVLVSLPFPHNVRHLINVAILTNVILMRQKHDETRLQAAVAAALTMNIGALDLHEDLFHRHEALSEEQRARIRAHPAASVEYLLARNVKNPLWLAIISQHHEALDGSGYPAGLAGDRILPEAQVVSLADRYCAMVTERANRDSISPPQALKEIHARHGKAISPALIGVLIGSMGLYPPGTLVRLANGETAVVVHRLIDPKHPVVYAIRGPSATAYDPPRKRLTASQPGYAIEQSVARKGIELAPLAEKLWPPVIAAAQAP